MSKGRKLKTLIHPQLWIGSPKNKLVEVVIIERFGAGSVAAHFWIPENVKFSGPLEKFHYSKIVKKRLAQDYGIDLGYYSGLISSKNPLTDRAVCV